MTQQTAKTLDIVLTKTTDSTSLFDFTDGADVDASMERFDDLLLDAVTAHFPEATVSLGQRGAIWDMTAEGDVNGSDTPAAFEAQQVIQDIAERILSDGEWIVETN